MDVRGGDRDQYAITAATLRPDDSAMRLFQGFKEEPGRE